MARVSVKIDNFLIKKSEDDVPNSVLNFLVAMQVLLGVNTGVFERYKGIVMKALKLLSQLLLPVRVIVICVYFNYKDICYLCLFLNILVNCVFFVKTKYSVLHFVTDIHALGGNESLKNSRIGNALFCYTFVIYLSLFVMRAFRSYVESIEFIFTGSTFIYAAFLICASSMDALSFMLILIICYIYCYVYHLRKRLISNLNLNDFEFCYAALVKTYKNIERLYNQIVITQIFFTIPRLMFRLWYMLVYMQANAEWYSYTTEWLFFLFLIIHMCIPPVISEMVNWQIDSIKAILNEKLRTEKDKEKSRDLKRVLHYMEARSLLSDIWRVIPLDLRLPLTLLSVCTTYFIVILQFTHLYD